MAQHADWYGARPRRRLDGARRRATTSSTWFPGFLAGGGVELPAGPAVADDPVAAWQHHADAVQARDRRPRGEESFTHPYAGTHRLADAVDRFYTADVFMHSWDLARASGQDAGLDEDFAGQLLEGMRPIEELLRDSGQYGARRAGARRCPASSTG